jgi:hypothetical protein
MSDSSDDEFDPRAMLKFSQGPAHKHNSAIAKLKPTSVKPPANSQKPKGEQAKELTTKRQERLLEFSKASIRAAEAKAPEEIFFDNEQLSEQENSTRYISQQ